MEPYQISLVIAFALTVAEVMTLTFVLLSFALAFCAIAIIQYLTGVYDINRDIGIFAVFSIFFTWFFRSLFHGEKDQKELKSNEDINQF